MSEELLQRDLIKNSEKIGKWDFYNIGATSIKSLKEYGIIRNVDYGEEEKKKIDGLIVQKKNVIAVIEFKRPADFKTNKQKNNAIKQELKVARKLGSRIIIATDTVDTVWVNVLTGNRIKDEAGQEIKTNFDAKDDKLPSLIEKINYSINELNDQIKPKQLVNPTDLAKQIWQDIWSVSGATPENCLYTFVELFIFKYLSDLGILQGVFSFNTLCDGFESNTQDEILETYASVIRPKIKTLFPENPIDRTTIINGTIFVSKDQKAVKGYSTVFKKVLGKFKDYGKLENIDYDFKSKLFESFLKESISKKNWGQFFTPLKVVRSIVEMAKDDIKEGSKICDPACGVGKFLLEPVITKLDQFYEIKKGKLTPKIFIHGYDKGFDKDEQKTIILAKANMLIYFSDLIKENSALTEQFSTLFNESFTLKTNSILGTLSEPVENEYDLILTNPPYVTSGSSNLKDEIKKDGDLIKYYKINGMGVEGLFMEWIVRALKPGGKAFVIVPDGILNRQNDKNIRQFFLDECYIDGIISLPIKTFFTTPKKTYILCITKKANKKEVQKDPVFTYLVSEIGESRDIYRFEIINDDLTEAVALYSFFKGNKSGFSKINNDSRCKIQPFNKFKPEDHWSVDRWWSNEEKIELGILEERDTIDLIGFGELISDASETLSDFSSLLKEVAEKKKTKSSLQEIPLTDTKYFELAIGKRVVKRDIVKIKGTLPIYSANVKEPVGFHLKSNITDFSTNFVLWGIDGDFEFNAIIKNTPFVSTDHCGTIRIKSDDILPDFLMIQLERVKHIYGFDRGLRASLKNMKGVSIQVPFNESGLIDIVRQKEVIAKYEYILDVRKSVNKYKERLKELNVSISSLIAEERFVELGISDILFSPPTNSGLKKIHITLEANSINNIPVYSASMDENAIFGFVSEQSKWRKYENLLTWNKDGSAGFVFYRKNRFVPYEKVKLLEIKEEYINTLSYEYLKHVVQNRLFEEGFGFNIKCSMDKVLKLKIPIPTKSNGQFHLEKQRQIAALYYKIDEIRNSVILELNKVSEAEIDLD
jgi:type I restriction enzyme M protein